MSEFRPNSAPVHPYHVPPKRTRFGPATMSVISIVCVFGGLILGRLIGGAG